MKTRRTFVSIIIAASIVIAVFICAFIFGSRTIVQDAIVSVLENNSLRSSDIKVSFDSLDRGFLYRIHLDNLSVQYKEREVFRTDEAEISVGLIDAIRIYRGKLSSSDVVVSVTGLDINLDDNLADFLSSDEVEEQGVVDVTVPGDEVDSASAAVEEKKDSSFKENFPGIRLNILDGSFHIDYSGIVADIPLLKGYLELGSGLVYKALNFSSEEASAVISEDEQENIITISGIRVAGTSEHTGLYINDITSSLYGTSGKLALTVDPSDTEGFLDLVVNANNLAVNVRDFDITLSKFSAAATLDTASLSGDVTAYVNNINVNKDDMRLSSELGTVVLSSFGTSDTSLDVKLNSFYYEDDKYTLDSPSFSVESDYINNGENVWVNISSNSFNASFNESVATITEISLSNLFAAVSYENNGLVSVNAESLVSGKSTDEAIGDFSSTVSGNVALDVFAVKELIDDQNASLEDYLQKIYASDVRVMNLTTSSIEDENEIYVKLTDENIFEVSLKSSDVLSVNLELDVINENAQLRMSLSDFAPYQYGSLIDRFVGPVGNYIDSETRIDASLSTSLTGSENSDVLIPNGNISLNAGARHAKFGSRDVNFAITVEADNDGEDIEVSSLAVSAFGMRLSFTGTVDSENYYPQGSLILQDSSDGSIIAGFDFDRVIDNSSYKYRAYLTEFDDLKLVGSAVRDPETGLIDASGKLTTIHDNMDLDIKIDTEALTLDAKSEYFDFYVGYDGGSAILIDGGFRALRMFFTDSVFVTVTGALDGKFDFVTRGFSFNASDVYVEVSDILNFGFNMDITENNFNMTDFRIGRRNSLYDFDGNISFSFDSIADLLSFDTSKINGIINLYIPGTENRVACSMIDNRYYADADIVISDKTSVSLELLGSRGAGFFANVSFGTISFEARLKEKILRLYNMNGSLGTFNIKAFDMVIDFVDRTLSGYTTIENFMDNIEGPVYQGATIDIEAKVDSLFVGALSFAGFDAEAEFKLGIRDAYLSDGFIIPDTEINLSYTSDRITVSGDMLNGYYSIEEQTFEFDVSEDFIFSFNATGQIGDNLEIYVSDVSLPVAALNQFMNTPFAHILSGTVKGDLLITGPANDVSLYGLLSVQKMELDIFYFPDQIYTLSNFNIVIYDHEISVAATPIAGHNSRTGNFFRGTFKIDVGLSSNRLESLECVIDTPNDDMYFWFPTLLGSSGELYVGGDVRGEITIWVRQGTFGIDLDILANDFVVDFELPQMPEWFYEFSIYCSINLNMKTGTNFEFFYPTRDNSFINFTLSENQTVDLVYDSAGGNLNLNGVLEFKSGRISYLNNDFIITEGSLGIASSDDRYSSGDLTVDLDLRARLREYVNGERYEIFLILQDANPDNLSPRFESLPVLSENEIVNILGQSIIPTDTTKITASSIASVAVAATDAIRNLGLIESNENFSIAKSVRETLGLDVFSIRSNILGNIIAQALPGEESEGNNISLVSRYLDGTSLYVGKYINDMIFARMTFLLKSENDNKADSTGHFLVNDLNLDMEFSFDWENPIGSFSVFTSPEELSVFDILDTIGFSFTKRITF
ncbi:MAG: translocation/assembly module TamB [Sphaerochaetaceae bacterium]|nr:translocation/assembly module TamB [Sphaerochaetaceae bacterium]